MNSAVYIVENYENGDMYGFKDREKALKFIIQRYLEDDFDVIKDNILTACKDPVDIEEVYDLLDYIRADLRQIITTGSIEGFMTMKEVVIEE